MELSRAAVLRIIRSIVFSSLSHQKATWDLTTPAAWHEQTGIKTGGLSLDSLQLLEVASHVAGFFRLGDVGVDDYLLRGRTLGDWVDLIRDALPEVSGIGFRSSGTTGAAKEVFHPEADLRQEIAELQRIFPDTTRIHAHLPAHHIYGFLLTVYLPEQADLPVADNAYRWGAGQLETAEGDLIVSHPDRWQYLSRMLSARAPGVRGVTSTAPMPAELWRGLGSRLESVTELYGSTETAGVAYRRSPDEPFTLFSYLARTEDGAVSRVHPDGGVSVVPLQDELQWQGARTFHVGARRDGAVQIGGRVVQPDRVAEQLCTIPGVSAATVRPWQGRLKAFVVPASGDGVGDEPGESGHNQTAHEMLRERVAAWVEEHLPAHERPVRITVGTELPTNQMGKRIDWSVDP
jgi:4-coumarate--CoA ligase (photoactive yellow protein activation family)